MTNLLLNILLITAPTPYYQITVTGPRWTLESSANLKDWPPLTDWRGWPDGQVKIYPCSCRNFFRARQL